MSRIDEKNTHLDLLIKQHELSKTDKNSPRLTTSQVCAMRNYQDSLRHGSEMFEITQLPGPDFKDIDEFLSQLILADVLSFAITAKDTSLIDFLAVLYKRGWRLSDVGELTRVDNDIVKSTYTLNAIVMYLR